MWPSLRTHLSKQMTPSDLENIYTTRYSCRDTLPCIETILSFLLTDGEASWLLLLSITPYHSATRKHVFLYPQEDRSGLRKPEKGQASILITSTTSIHLPNLVSIDLTIKSDLVLTNPIGKDGMCGWSM